MKEKTVDLVDKVNAIAFKVLERAGQLPQGSVSEATLDQQAQLVLLPFCEDKYMGVPNVILRSALFAAIRRGRRKQHFSKVVSTLNGTTIKHTGPALDQADLDVWEHCLALARENGLGNVITFSSRNFLRAVGRSDGKGDRTWLASALLRLAASVVEVNSKGVSYHGSMIHEVLRDENTGQYMLKLNVNIANMFAPDAWSKVDWEHRMKLRGYPLAQWLHGFYSSHASPHAYKVETLHKLCGSETAELKHFMRPLRSALERIAAQIPGWKWLIKDGLVDISHKPTPSQTRHVLRKVTGK